MSSCTSMAWSALGLGSLATSRHSSSRGQNSSSESSTQSGDPLVVTNQRSARGHVTAAANHSSPVEAARHQDLAAELDRGVLRPVAARQLAAHAPGVRVGAEPLHAHLHQPEHAITPRDLASTNHSSPRRSGCWSSGTPRRPWRAAPCPPGSPSHTERGMFCAPTDSGYLFG